MYNEVLNFIRCGIELLNYFLNKEKRGVALKSKNGLNLSKSSIFEHSLVLVKLL